MLKRAILGLLACSACGGFDGTYSGQLTTMATCGGMVGSAVNPETIVITGGYLTSTLTCKNIPGTMQGAATVVLQNSFACDRDTTLIGGTLTLSGSALAVSLQFDGPSPGCSAIESGTLGSN